MQFCGMLYCFARLQYPYDVTHPDRCPANAALYARIASAKPITRASAVSSCPIEASANPRNAAVSGGRLSRFKSWPMLTTKPSSAARAAVATQARSRAAGSPARKAAA